MNALEYNLLAFLILCSNAASLTKHLLTSVVIFMSYSVIMSVLWIVLESPDLAITEAAVGAGVTGILFFITLREVDQIKGSEKNE